MVSYTDKMKNDELLRIENLTIGFFDKESPDKVVNQLSLSVGKGEMLGIVGESGSGKSVTAMSILGLLERKAKVISGNIYYQDMDLLKRSEKDMASIKGKEIAMIFQEPMTSLNPVQKVGQQVEEMLRIHEDIKDRNLRRERVYKAFDEVGLSDPPAVYDKYPHELSGGMRQRAMIAMAMICRPKLLIADEPTTALDVTIQAQILALLRRLNRKYHTAIILISHDLHVIRHTCSRALVMKDGHFVEEGGVEELFLHPKEDYTKTLLGTHPQDPTEASELSAQEIRSANPSNILIVDNLDIYYYQKGSLFSKREKKKIVKGVSFSLQRGEILGIVGESGSGKSTLLKAVAGLADMMDGDILLNHTKPQMVFQDPYGSLNPAKTIQWILEEPLKIQGGYTKREREKYVTDMMLEVGLKEEYLNRNISQLSGGQRQRVSIANALLCGAELILLDEPVSALDVTVQEQILSLLLQLSKERGLSYLFISHDLKVVERICQRVLIMYEGKIIEAGDVEEIYRNPKEDYTKKLLSAIMEPD